MAPTITRRQLIGASGGLAAARLLSTPGSALGQEATTSPAAEGSWSFTDDKGVTVSLPSMPLRIVADVNAAAPLWDFGIRPLAVFGWNATESGDFGPAGGRVDPTQVEVVGNAAETIIPEKVAALNPDLIVTITWTPDVPGEYWSIGEDILPQITPIAPIVAISANGSADENMERFAELAELLGADLASPELAADKARYDAALGQFKQGAQDKSDLTSLFTYIDGEAIYYVANAEDWADLTFYQNLGLSIVKPDAEKDSFWQELSVEEGLTYPADVFFHSTRPGTLSAEELKAHPIFGQHPAVKAGQLGAWNQDFILSFRGMAEALEATITAMSAATKII